mgnify:CR=1 FL=1
MAKLTPEILDEIVASFHRVGGQAYLDELALRDPPTFCLLLGKIIQAEVKAATPVYTNQFNLSEAMATAEARITKLDHDQ